MDRDLKQDTYRDGDQQPELEPDPIPNLVLHPGDTLTTAADPDGYASVHLSGADGYVYAVLDCASLPPDGYRIEAIRSVARPGYVGERLLRVRPDGVPQSLPGPYSYAVVHSHHHAHGTGAGDVLTHAHQHEHAGAEAGRANELGHTADVHVHKH